MRVEQPVKIEEKLPVNEVKMGDRLACKASLWYNRRVNVEPLQVLKHSKGVSQFCLGELTMTTLPLHASDGNPSKTCSKCKRVLSTDLFHRKGENGLQSQCKECKVNKKPPNAPEGYKRCSQCDEVYPATLEYFSAQSMVKSGLRSRCKVCTSVNHQEYISDPEVKERLRAYGESYQSQLEVKQHRHDYHQIYHARPEIRKRRNEVRNKWRGSLEVRERDRLYAENHRSTPEWQEWHQNYSARLDVKMRRRGYTHNYRARKKSALGTYTIEQIQDLMLRQKHRCYYCNARFGRSGKQYIYHIDHVEPLSRGGSNDISNLVLTCPSCNTSKKDKLPHEWLKGGRLL